MLRYLVNGTTTKHNLPEAPKERLVGPNNGKTNAEIKPPIHKQRELQHRSHLGTVSRKPTRGFKLLSLSRPRLSRITAYLEVEIWSLPKLENLTNGKNYCGKEEKLLLRSNFSSFPQYFQYISDFKSPITHIFIKCGFSNYFSLNSANLICRGTDFRESLEIRDNESRL